MSVAPAIVELLKKEELMKALILIVAVALMPIAFVSTPASAKVCGVHYVSHQSKVTGHFSTRKLYQCS